MSLVKKGAFFNPRFRDNGDLVYAVCEVQGPIHAPPIENIRVVACLGLRSMPAKVNKGGPVLGRLG